MKMIVDKNVYCKPNQVTGIKHKIPNLRNALLETPYIRSIIAETSKTSATTSNE